MTKDLIIICFTIFAIIFTITFAIFVENINETPYEQCLQTCEYSDKIHCARTCNEAVIEIFNNLVKETRPLIEKVLERENE